MKTKILLITLLLLSVFTFGQRAKQDLKPDNVNAKNKITTPFLQITKLETFDEVKSTTVAVVVGDTSGVQINWQLGNIQQVVMADTAEVTMISPSYPCRLTLFVIHAADTVNRDLFFTVPVVKWVGGTDYTPTNTSGAVDKIEFVFNGTNYYAFFNKDFKN